jgi:hypothetical protein
VGRGSLLVRQPFSSIPPIKIERKHPIFATIQCTWQKRFYNMIRLTSSFGFYMYNAMKLRSLTRSLIENCALLDFYAANTGNSLTTFRDMSITSSWPLKMEAIGCPKTSAKNYNYSLRNSSEECGSHLLRDGSLMSRTRLPVRKDFPHNLLTPSSSIGSLRRAT